MNAHIREMLILVAELRTMGEKLKEQLVVALILGLPDCYDAVVLSFEV